MNMRSGGAWSQRSQVRSEEPGDGLLDSQTRSGRKDPNRSGSIRSTVELPRMRRRPGSNSSTSTVELSRMRRRPDSTRRLAVELTRIRMRPDPTRGGFSDGRAYAKCVGDQTRIARRRSSSRGCEGDQTRLLEDQHQRLNVGWYQSSWAVVTHHTSDVTVM